MKVSISTLLAQKGPQKFVVSADATVAEAVHEMNSHKVGCIMVLDGDNLVGVFTERDVLHRVVAANLPAMTTPVSQVMTTPVETVRPDMSIDEAMVTITEKRHRHLPVMDEGKLIGLVSIGDITRWLVQAHQNEAQNLWHYITGNYPS
ncbi:MAG: histidine kinase [Verrucomicrobia bacterium]|nr:MAG: histidine kinase [Verrucomicrobiota bacterium]